MRYIPIVTIFAAMTSKIAASHHAAFTAEDMLSAPRPQPGLVSPDKRHSLSVVDQWDPKSDSTTRSVYLVSLDESVKDTVKSLFTSKPSEAGEFLWLDEHAIAYLNGSSLCSFSIDSASSDTTEHKDRVAQPTTRDDSVNPTKLLDFPEGVNPTGLKYQAATGHLIFSGQVWDGPHWGPGDFDKTAEHDKAWAERGTTGVVYDELFVRHWDTWRTPGKVWTIGAVRLNDSSSSSVTLVSSPKFHNILRGSQLVSRMDPHGSIAVSPDQIVFTVKNPNLSYAKHTREDAFIYTPYPSDGADVDFASADEPKMLTTFGHGAISGLSFSPDFKRLAWLEMGEDGYESDKRVVVVHERTERGWGAGKYWTDEWDRSPSSVTWSMDSQSMFLIAEHQGRALPYHLTHQGHLPTPLTFEHTTSAITPLSSTSLLLTMSSFTSPNDDFVLDLASMLSSDDDDKSPNRHLEQLTHWSSKHIDGRLSNIEIEDLWFKGADAWDVMAWVLKPAGADKARDGSLPLAFFVHGGPQGAWEDGWSTRWNPALFAAQGYMVVAVNPTGSTGYGQEFCDKIKKNWGGSPFKDLLAGFQAALETYPQIDRERTGMLGASYGGYMANWIQGHNDQFRFKAIVCHDGIFDTTSAFYETEEVWFPTREFGGNPTQVRATYEKWNPMNHVAEWKTPELVIHSGKDFRLIDGQGIAAFTALQVHGVPSRFLYFPDENHWVLKASNSIKWHLEVFRWLEEWIGDKSKVVEDLERELPSLVIQQ